MASSSSSDYKFLFFFTIIILTWLMLSLKISHNKKINELCISADYLFTSGSIFYPSYDHFNADPSESKNDMMKIYEAVKSFKSESEIRMEKMIQTGNYDEAFQNSCLEFDAEGYFECIANRSISVFEETAMNFETYQRLFDKIYKICGEEPKYRVMDFIYDTSRLKDDMESLYKAH